MSRFLPQLYPLYQFTTLPKQIWDLHKWIQKNILHVAGSAFVKGVYTPYGLRKSGNHGKCPYCNSNRVGKTDEEMVEEIMKRVKANDAVAMGMLGSYYYHGYLVCSKITIKQLNYGLGQQAADRGCSKAHINLSD